MIENLNFGVLQVAHRSFFKKITSYKCISEAGIFLQSNLFVCNMKIPVLQWKALNPQNKPYWI